jgi:hypothetical protein
MVVVVDLIIAEQFPITACAIWFHDVLAGNFVPLIGLLNQGNDNSVKLSASHFSIDKNHGYSYLMPVGEVACLLDPGCGIQCDTLQAKSHTKIVLIVELYNVRSSLAEYSTNKKIPKRTSNQTFEVYRNWLKKYLDFYNPGFYEFFDTSVNGTKVNVIHSANAAMYQGAYKTPGVDEYFLDVIPLPKSYPAAFLDRKFVKNYAPASSQKDRTNPKSLAGA